MVSIRSDKIEPNGDLVYSIEFTNSTSPFMDIGSGLYDNTIVMITNPSLSEQSGDTEVIVGEVPLSVSP